MAMKSVEIKKPDEFEEHVKNDVDHDNEETVEEEIEYEEVEEEVEVEEEEDEEEEEEEVEEEVEEEEEDDEEPNRDSAQNAQTDDKIKDTEMEEVDKMHAELLALPPHGSEVYVGGFSQDVSDNDLRRFCESIGEVTEVNYVVFVIRVNATVDYLLDIFLDIYGR